MLNTSVCTPGLCELPSVGSFSEALSPKGKKLTVLKYTGYTLPFACTLQMFFSNTLAKNEAAVLSFSGSEDSDPS